MEQAQKLKDVGNEYYKLHKFEEAIQKYLEASKLQPQEPGILHFFFSFFDT